MEKKTISFLRREQYRALSRLRVDGRILDIGGSKHSGYHELIQGEREIITGNIDEAYGIDVIFDAQERWPFEDASFDAVILMNVLEHLYHHREAIAEAHRVLAPGAVAAGAVPFMINVHGSPNDYFRYTRSALERLFTDAGFTDVKIEELGSGSFGVIYHCLLGFIRWNWLANVAIPFFRCIDRLIAVLKPGNKMSKIQMPLGYYFEARKP